MIDGARVPCTLVLDRTLTVVEEIVDPEALERVTIGRQDAVTGNRPIADADRAVMARWVTEEVPNPLPGTSALRDEYLAARRVMIKEHEDQGHPCPPCQLGGLIQRYRDILKNAGHLPS